MVNIDTKDLLGMTSEDAKAVLSNCNVKIQLAGMSDDQQNEMHNYIESLNTGHCGSILSLVDANVLRLGSTGSGQTTYPGRSEGLVESKDTLNGKDT